MKKKDFIIFGLLGIGAVAVVYFLFYESANEQAAEAENAIPEPGGGIQNYPNTQPLAVSPSATGSTPPAQSYNLPANGAQLASVKVGTQHSGCGCEDSDCEEAGVATTVQRIPAQVLESGAKNLMSFHAKIQGKVMSGVEAAMQQKVGAGKGAPAVDTEDSKNATFLVA